MSTSIYAGNRCLEITALSGLPEVRPGDDIAALIAEAVRSHDAGLCDCDILVVTSKIVSKAEGRMRTDESRAATIIEETARVVARRGDVVIAQTHHGFVMAAAGVDASNTERGTVLMLPLDPDASAARIRQGIRDRLGINVGVILSDTFGRPWRIGQTDLAIGVAGVWPTLDYKGMDDSYGNPLQVTHIALSDEIAAAGDLVKGKLTGTPIAVVRGLAQYTVNCEGRGVAELVRAPEEDMFRYGSRDVVFARRTIKSFSAQPVDPGKVARAVIAATAAPVPHERLPWRFVLLESAQRRRAFVDTLDEAVSSNLRSDGMSEASIAKLIQCEDVLRNAPYLVVPCMVVEDALAYRDERRTAAEREVFVMSMGAGVQNFLIQLAVEGLGSAWVTSTMFCSDRVREVLDLPPGWEPMGAVAIGHPATVPSERETRQATDFILRR